LLSFFNCNLSFSHVERMNRRDSNPEFEPGTSDLVFWISGE
jgi:hypothetical protein